MIEYKRMVRTMRRRMLLALLAVSIVVLIASTPPLSKDHWVTALTPDSVKELYRHRGAADQLVLEINNVQRRLERYLKRSSTLTSLEVWGTRNAKLADSPERERMQITQRRSSIDRAFKEGQRLLERRQVTKAIAKLEWVKVELSRLLDDVVAWFHFVKAQAILRETNNRKPSLTGNQEPLSHADAVELRKRVTSYVEQHRIADAADILVDFLERRIPSSHKVQ